MQKTLLCRNRRTGGFVFVNPNIKPSEGDLVAVRYGARLTIESFVGQANLGVIVDAEGVYA